MTLGNDRSNGGAKVVLDSFNVWSCFAGQSFAFGDLLAVRREDWPASSREVNSKVVSVNPRAQHQAVKWEVRFCAVRALRSRAAPLSLDSIRSRTGAIAERMADGRVGDPIAEGTFRAGVVIERRPRRCRRQECEMK